VLNQRTRKIAESKSRPLSRLFIGKFPAGTTLSLEQVIMERA
jgi:hypothetical protein